jgi:peptide chain release factor 1
MIKQKLDEMARRFDELQAIVSQSETLKDQKRYKELMQELANLTEVVEEYRKFKKLDENLQNTEDVIKESTDEEMKSLAQEELQTLRTEQEELLKKLQIMIIPKDPLDNKDIIMEIRAGTGGDEAALFAADLYRMYSKYAERMNWKLEILSIHDTGIGGLKEIIFSVKGKSVYAELRYESGVHRVQRVPVTEAGGRIHTSAVTVAVLPEAEETDIEIKPEEIRVDVFRSSGPGGQSVNTTDSAVRITHLPTGLVVSCQDEKSQHKNKAKALRVLRSRLYEMEERKKQEERAKERRLQVGTGDRSERIRTYNFPQNRLTDHRINLTLYKLDYVMEGDMVEILHALKLSAKEEYLKKA